MKYSPNIALVTTIGENCRACYACVRECPAKAIRIENGQAKVLPPRCIGCGNCVRVCSQGAKHVLDSRELVREILESGERVAAILAPSFPAEFRDCGHTQVAGMLRALGFEIVSEVGFGADLVARAYRNLIETTPDSQYIATTCPAVVAYVERYFPQLVAYLAPVVSPMVAMARALKQLHGADLRVVFIGPCIAKKGEVTTDLLPGEMDAALTFAELREMLAERGIGPSASTPCELDPPHARAGALFPINRGLLQAACIDDDLSTGEVVAVDGRNDFVDAIRAFDAGQLQVRLLELLACNGCIMGPGFTQDASVYTRRSAVALYVRERQETVDKVGWYAAMKEFETLNLNRIFAARDTRLEAPSEAKLSELLARLGKHHVEDELNCGACGYDTCREHAIAMYKGLAEAEMCLPFAIERLRSTVNALAISNEQLAATKDALKQSEKLATMGQLAAGIAHELNNPLGIVLMYSHLMQEESNVEDRLREDLSVITDQADRCKRIVGGLLHFARQNKVVLESTDVCRLIDKIVRTLQKPENVKLRIEHKLTDSMADIDRDQITQVLTNLVVNAFAAMPEGGDLTIRTAEKGAKLELTVSDTGCGIPAKSLEKIFEPFFTTKEIGMGTGLGLAVTYGIVKMHRGDIRVISNADAAAGPTGATFIVTLPRRAPHRGKSHGDEGLAV